jgi:hypothetical protein
MKSVNELDLKNVLKESVQFHQPSVSFEQIWDLHKNRNKLPWTSKPKKKIAFLLITLVILPTIAFGSYSWSNIRIELNSGKSAEIDYSNVNKRFEIDIYEHLIKLTQENPKKYKIASSLLEAEKVADFPLRQPFEITGWKNIHKIGLLDDGNLTYTDIYLNDKGIKVFVEQRYNSFATSAMKGEEGQYISNNLPGSKIVEGFGDDLAILLELKNNRKILSIYHKETDQVTDIDIWGENTDISTLKSFYLAYLQSPGKQGILPSEARTIIENPK